MAATNAVYDGNSLQTANILTQSIDHFSIGTKTLNAQPLAHGNKSVIPFIDYPNKTILISGIIIDTTIAALDNRLDVFRAYFNGQDKNLDIDYGSGQRRYIATISDLKIERPNGLLYAKFEINFFCIYPFGYDTTATTLINDTAQTAVTYAPTCTFTGSAPIQKPVLTYTLISFTTGGANLVTNFGFEVDTSGWTVPFGTLTRVTAQNHSGVAAGQVVNGATQTYGYFGSPYTALSGLTIGNSYTVSVWVKGNAGGENISVGQYTLAASASLTATTGWQQLTYTFTATSTTYNLCIESSTSSATWFFDDVSLTVNSSSTVNIGNAATGQTIAVTRTFAAGDVLIIDTVNKTVKVNGVEIFFSGAFPEFKLGAGGFGYSDTFATRSFNFNVAVVVGWI